MTHPQKLLIATHNPAKKQELKNGFSPLLKSEINLLFLDDLHIENDPEETGKTFEENANLKAKYFARLTNLPTIADDGGIEIDVLNRQPGVHSKRWLGKEATDEELIRYTLKRLKNVLLPQRTAQFTVCLSYFNPTTKYTISVTESLKGHIALSHTSFAQKGFPYRALFIVNKFNTYYDELSVEEHGEVNHRLKAVSKLTPFIKKDLLQ